jgi:hypothetical protein
MIPLVSDYEMLKIQASLDLEKLRDNGLIEVID